MGIDVVTAPLLANAARYERPTGDAIMLGRQTMQIPRARASRFNAYAKDFTVPTNYGEIHDIKPTYAERFFEKIGIAKIQSLDASGYEESSYIHDLNKPIDKKLTNKFSFIFDGGTLEHVFNVPQAFDNVHDMLKPGGIFVSATTGDGWFGHGFWQMSPEIVFSYWGSTRGYKVLDVKEVPVRPRFAPVDIPDPRSTGKRSKKHYKKETAYLWYVVKKPAKQRPYKTPQQSDYQTIWDGND